MRVGEMPYNILIGNDFIVFMITPYKHSIDPALFALIRSYMYVLPRVFNAYFLYSYLHNTCLPGVLQVFSGVFPRHPGEGRDLAPFVCKIPAFAGMTIDLKA